MSAADAIVPSLHAAITPVQAIDTPDQRTMFRLYAHYYAGSSEALFRSDLLDKDYALLLRDQSGVVRGFSTIAIIDDQQTPALRALFSGDTIIDRALWGQQNLAFNWIRFAGRLKSQRPATPLYWFLIVKGHRTYRYLSAFSLEYYPHHAHPTPTPIADLMARLAGARFGEYYDAANGIVRFPSSRGHLRPQWAQVTKKEREKPEVRYFLERNPNYARGDELVCLTELVSYNLKPLARRLFLRGMEGR